MVDKKKQTAKQERQAKKSTIGPALDLPTDNPQAPKGEYAHGPGKTTVAPEVLLTIARLAALRVEGVNRMSSVPGGVNRLFERGLGDGVRLEVYGERITADLYLVLNAGHHVRDVSRQVQIGVGRALSEMVGMNVGRVNIHIEDIEYANLQGESLAS